MYKKYFYSRETLELMADETNGKYYPERLEKVLPLDPYDLLEKQGLDVEWKYISPNEQLLGLIFFADEQFPVWNKGTFEQGDKPHCESFKRGTIVINNILKEKKYLSALMKIAIGLKTKNTLKIIQKTSFKYVIPNR